MSATDPRSRLPVCLMALAALALALDMPSGAAHGSSIAMPAASSRLATTGQILRTAPPILPVVVNQSGGRGAAVAWAVDGRALYFAEGPRVRMYAPERGEVVASSAAMTGLVSDIAVTDEAVIVGVLDTRDGRPVPGGIAVLDPATLRERQSVRGIPRDIAVSRKHVLMATGDHIDVYAANAVGLTLESRYYWPAVSLAIDGDRVVAATAPPEKERQRELADAVLLTLDSGKLRLEDGLIHPSPIVAVNLRDSTAVLSTSEGLTLFDIGAGDFRHLSSMQLESGSLHLEFGDAYATSVNGTRRATMLDIENRQRPRTIGELGLREPAIDVAALGEALAFSGATGGFSVWQGRLPALPALTGEYYGTGALTELVRSGDKLWAAGDAGVVRLAEDDLSIQAAWRSRPGVALAEAPAGVHVIAVDLEPVVVTDPVGKANARLATGVQSRPAPGPRLRVALNLLGHLRQSAAGGDSLEPSAPFIRTSAASSLGVHEGYLLLGTHGAGLQVLDPADLAASMNSPLGMLPMTGFAADWTTVGESLVALNAGDSSFLETASLGAYPRLEHQSTLPIEGFGVAVAAADEQVVIATTGRTSGGRLTVYDWSNPSDLATLDGLDLTYAPTDIQINARQLIVVGNLNSVGHVDFFEVADSGRLSRIAGFTKPWSFTAVALDGGRAFLASREAGVMEVGLRRLDVPIYLPLAALRYSAADMSLGVTSLSRSAMYH